MEHSSSSINDQFCEYFPYRMCAFCQGSCLGLGCVLLMTYREAHTESHFKFSDNFHSTGLLRLQSYY